MARPKKDNADYFSHDSGMRNHRKIKALRSKFGHEGYSIWIMMLEHICSCDHFLAPRNEIEKEILAGDFLTDCGRLNEVVEFLLQIGLLQLVDNYIKSQSLIDRLTPMLEKRERERNKFLPQKLHDNNITDTETPIIVTETLVSVAESTQSKGKESKGKEIKGNEINSKTEFDSFSNSSTQDKIVESRKRNEVNTRGKFWISIRNEITGRMDMMESKTFWDLQNFISDMDNKEFEKRVKIFKECVDRINKYKLSKFMDVFGKNNIEQYSITEFISKINMFGGSIDDVFKQIVSKDNVNKVLRIIHGYNIPEEKPTEKEPEVELSEEEKKRRKEELNNVRGKLLKKISID